MSTQERAAKSPKGQTAATFFEFLSRPGISDPEEQDVRRRFIFRLVALTVLLAGHVWVSMQSRNLGYEEQALGRLIHRLDQERVEIEIHLASESNAALLAARAAELGMQRPIHGQLRRLSAVPGAPGSTNAKP